MKSVLGVSQHTTLVLGLGGSKDFSLKALPHSKHQTELFSVALASSPCTARSKEQDWLFWVHTLRAGSPTSSPLGPSLLCCTHKEQGPLPRVLWLLRGRNSSPALMTSDLVPHATSCEDISPSSIPPRGR